MKLVLLLLAIFALLWLMRRSRHRNRSSGVKKPPTPTAPQPMVACALCGVHLPQGEALPGRGGVFCDEAHRAAFERTHPGS